MTAKVHNFADYHRAKAVDEISQRINLDWDASDDPASTAWDRAVRQYASEIYDMRMTERRAARGAK